MPTCMQTSSWARQVEPHPGSGCSSVSSAALSSCRVRVGGAGCSVEVDEELGLGWGWEPATRRPPVAAQQLALQRKAVAGAVPQAAPPLAWPGAPP